MFEACAAQCTRESTKCAGKPKTVAAVVVAVAAAAVTAAVACDPLNH